MKSVAIIGGGVAGLEAAANLAHQGLAVTIVEKNEQLGGRLNQWHALFPFKTPTEPLLHKLRRSLPDGVNTLLNARVIDIEKNEDGFAIHMKNNKVITADTILLTTGFDIFDASRKEEYGYGIYDNVITSVELEQKFKTGGHLVNAQGKTPTRIGFVHCVGSRDEKAGNMHCSKVCCVTAVKQAIEVKEKLPFAEVFLFYMDLRMFGRHFEELYKEAQFKYGIQFIRARLSEAFENPDGSVHIRIEDTLLAKPLKMSLDMLVLMVGIQSHKEPGNLIDMLQLDRDKDGFPHVADIYESPYQTKIPGLFVAGGITGPKTIEETLADARAVTNDIKAYLKKIENFAGHESYILEL